MNLQQSSIRPRFRVLCLALSLALSACGGAGYVRPTPMPAPPPGTPPPTTPPPVTPPPTTPPADGGDQPAVDAQLTITNTNVAHAQGYTGTGVIIGLADSGIMRNHPALAGRVLGELTYVDPRTNNLAVDDVAGHGTMVAEIAAGTPVGKFAGGIAPGAGLVSARILNDDAPHDNGSQPPAQVGADDAVPFGRVAGDLAAAGVSIMNNSWGGITWSASDTATTQAFAAAYRPFITGVGGLVVFAAGNDSQPNPSTIAALPLLAPDLAPGWLTVVAVDSNHPSQLAGYSNQCGAAMHACLAAPGDVVVSGAADTLDNMTYWVVSGTSFSAPMVSGAAALVWQAYPYFNNDLVRQTLLGTADDLGAPGVDPVFGYGELDVGRAVNGPMRFDWGDVTVAFAGTSSWNNPISGAGGLVKQGPGTLLLTQPASYTGLTAIQGGTLSALALAGDVNVAAGGTLDRTGAVAGNVTNTGVVSVRGGDTTVGGNYVQQDSGRLAVSLGSALRVAGSATLAGGDLLVTGIEAGYVANSHTEVLSAQGGLTGTFADVAKADNVTLLTASAAYDATTAWLDVSQVSASAVAGTNYTAASAGAARRVDAAFGAINAHVAVPTATGTPVPSGFVAGAAALQHGATAATLQPSLESLSGQLHAASAAMTFQAIDAGTRALSERFGRLLDDPQAGVWAQGLGYHGNLSRRGYGDIGYDLSGWLAGQDFRVDGGVAGFALARSQGLGRRIESADQGYSHATEAMVYGGTTRGAWYAMGRLGVGDYRETMRRQLQLGDQFGGVFSDSRGRYGVAYGESGYRLNLAHVRFMPYASMEYAQIQRDGFDELGGDGFGLKSGALTTARWQAGVGVRAGRSWQLAHGSLALDGRLAAQRSFGLRGEVFQASFSGLNQWAPLGGVGLSRHGGVAGATLDWSVGGNRDLVLGYDHYFGQYQQATMATLAYRWAF